MNIAPTVLADQCARARAMWPFIDQVNDEAGLPVGLLLAVGSRETNLTDELGDGGHGHGVWQLDDRSHVIPDPFPVDEQAAIAAEMLHDNYARFGTWLAAVNAYNSGRPDTVTTTGGDYGPDVLDRQAWIATNTEEVAVPLTADDLTKITTIVQEQVDASITRATAGPSGSVFVLMTRLYNNQFRPWWASIAAKVGAPNPPGI